MKSILIIFLSALITSGTAAEINLNLSGVVVDGQTHEPVENAIVHIIGTDIHEVTDKNGEFIFNNLAPGSYRLKTTMLGYKPREDVVRLGKDINRKLFIHLIPVPVQTGSVIITGEHPTLLIDEALGTSTLRGKDLQREMGLTLASTLKNETGISMRSMGPAPARPVVRGLGGENIRINEDGIGTVDLSASSPDHALTVESFTSERIEVIRGPKMLLYSQGTTGGVINIIKDEIPSGLSDDISGNIGLLGESVNKGYLGSAVIDIPITSLQFRGEITRKKASDVNTPGGTLLNSGFSNLNFITGGSFIYENGFAGFSYKHYDTDYKIPGGFIGAHPGGVDISMERRQVKGKLVLESEGIFNKTQIDLSRSYYRHREFEKSGLTGADFTIYDYQGTVSLQNSKIFLFDGGASGVQTEYKDYRIGGYVFTSPSVSLNISPFIFQSYSGENFEIQAAVRYNFSRITPDEENPSSRIGHIRERQFSTFSLAGAFFYEVSEGLYAGFNLSKTSRVPTAEELFSEGPHLAAYSYETGNPDLNEESGFGTELMLFFKSGVFSSGLTLFRYDYNSFILPRNTGRINYATLLPVYQSYGVKALLTGVESEIHFHIFNQIQFTGSLSYVYGNIKGTSNPLSSIPPFKGLAELKYMGSSFSAGIILEGSLPQDRVDIFEEKTAGYLTAGLFAQFIFSTDRFINSISLSADNLLDKEYRNHLSRVKSVVPENGRNVRATYRFYF